MQLSLFSLLDRPEDSYLRGWRRTKLFEPQFLLLEESLPCRLFWEFQSTLGQPDEASFSDSPGGKASYSLLEGLFWRIPEPGPLPALSPTGRTPSRVQGRWPRGGGGVGGSRQPTSGPRPGRLQLTPWPLVSTVAPRTSRPAGHAHFGVGSCSPRRACWRCPLRNLQPAPRAPLVRASPPSRGA